MVTEAVCKRHRIGDVDVDALVEATPTIAAGEAVSIVGPSGSGQSTLMNLLGCLDRPSAGRYLLEEQDVSRLTRGELAALRSRRIGFVFQTFNLLARATALENVELPMIYAGLGRRRSRAHELLEAVGLADRAHHLPPQLSGGQQQRVAIARALANGPNVLLADEPTGSLDSRTSSGIMNLLASISAHGLTLILVTHDERLSAAMPRVISLRHGRIVSDIRRPRAVSSDPFAPAVA